jgi:glycosyltransferase involved in cell wall biosynthesis
MNLAIVSNVSGCAWAGSEEVWYRMAIMALQNGARVLACLHQDLLAGEPLKQFVKSGGELINWRRRKIARFENFAQKIAPNFTNRRLGHPELILLSCGSLPGITYVPGLLEYLKESNAKFAVLCLFNAESLAISTKERREVAWILKNSKANVFVAEQNRALAVRQFGISLNSASVFYGPLRERFEAPLPMPCVDSTPIFSCVARLDMLWKGQDILLEVLSSNLWKSRHWKLRIYGNGSDKLHIEHLVKMFGLEDRTTFAGFVNDTREIWADSQLMVLPSRGEGTPLATLEAMMCGRPVVTTDVGGNREVLEEGLTGWIADAATPRSFAQAMERAWLDRGRWAEMGRAAHLKAIEVDAQEPPRLLLEVIKTAIG